MTKENKQKIDYKEVARRTESLDWFKNVERSKLIENTYKGTWENDSMDLLLTRLKDEVAELEEALESGCHDDIIRECGDVSVSALIIADRYRKK